MGYSSWGRKGSDTTEQLTLSLSGGHALSPGWPLLPPAPLLSLRDLFLSCGLNPGFGEASVKDAGRYIHEK